MALLYQLTNIAHAYNGRLALVLDRFEVASGVIIGLVGPNGSGKSTLLKLLGFIERPSRGEIFYNGYRSDPFTPGVRDQVTLVPQEGYLLRRTVYGNIAYGLRIRSDRVEERRRVHQALALVGLAPERFAPRAWFALSGGEARRVALAARLVLKPKVLLLDEPTTSVDAASAQLIKEAVLQAHQQWGTTLVIASHDHDWLQNICDTRLNLFEGKSLGCGQKLMVFGPWRPAGGGLLAHRLSDDQEFLAGHGPADPVRATAAIDPEQITLGITMPSLSPDRHCLKGTVQRLWIDKPGQRLNASVQVGSTLFPAVCADQGPTRVGCLPGQTVWMSYDPNVVQWY